LSCLSGSNLTYGHAKEEKFPSDRGALLFRLKVLVASTIRVLSVVADCRISIPSRTSWPRTDSASLMGSGKALVVVLLVSGLEFSQYHDLRPLEILYLLVHPRETHSVSMCETFKPWFGKLYRTIAMLLNSIYKTHLLLVTLGIRFTVESASMRLRRGFV
jgi:hypothetical protein